MKNLVDVFQALGEETRIKILSMLGSKEMCVDELIQRLELSQSAVSHHVKVLKNAGLVERRRKGKWTIYCLNPNGLHQLEEGIKAWMMSITETTETTENTL